MSLPIDIVESAKKVVAGLLPTKSVHKYISKYNEFIMWKSESNVHKDDFSETTMLAYFGTLKGKFIIFLNMISWFGTNLGLQTHIVLAQCGHFFQCLNRQFNNTIM